MRVLPRVSSTMKVKRASKRMREPRKATSGERSNSGSGNVPSKVSPMAGKKNFDSRLNQLFQEEKWTDARKLLERELEKNPASHWLLTQLGVTLYEQRKYRDALEMFLASLRIVDDCPLTLWNLAGAMDALGNHAKAIKIYTWLVESKRTAKDDPCWESNQWTDSLKADCAYRLGVCFEHLGKKEQAEECYRHYLNLLATGIEGQYSVEDVLDRIRSLQGAASRKATGRKLQKAFESTLRKSGVAREQSNGGSPPRFASEGLFVGRRVASKR